MNPTKAAPTPVEFLTLEWEPRLDDLVNELHRAGLTVHILRELPSADAVTSARAIVVVVEELIAQQIPEQQLRAFAGTVAEVIPVSLRPPGTVDYLADLSHMILGATSIPEAAQDIAKIVIVGGKRITEWNRHVVRAKDWEESPQSVPLLSEADGRDVALILADPPELFSADEIAVVRRYADASAAARARRRRTAISVLSIVSVLLVALIVLAGLQTVNANNSRTVADDRRASAEADRIADLAVRMTPADPDLPAILLHDATEIKVTQRVREAANTVAASTWPHRSIKLTGEPRVVSAAADAPRAAVMFSDEPTIVIYDTSTAEVVTQVRAPQPTAEGTATIALSPDGSTVAIQYESEQLQLFPVSEGGPPTTIAESDVTLLGWWDESSLVLATRAGLERRPVSLGVPFLLVPTPPADGPVRGYARAEGGSAVAAITADALHYAPHGQRPVRTPVEGAMDVALSADGRTVGVAAFPESRLISFGDDLEPDSSPLDVNATQVEALGTRAFAFGTRDGRIVQYDAADRRATLVRSILAHTRSRLRASTDTNGTVATVGLDGYLRLWTPEVDKSEDVPLPFGLHHMKASVFAAQRENAYRESTRHQIRLRPGTNLATVLMQPNYYWTVDVSDGKAISDRPTYFGGLNADSSLSPRGTASARVISDGAGFATIAANGRLKQAGTIEETPVPMTIAGRGEGVLSVNDDGNVLVMADSTRLSCWSTAANSARTQDHRFDTGRIPVAMSAHLIDGQARCIALTADGYLRDQTGNEKQIDDRVLTEKIVSGDLDIAAGEFADDQRSVVAVTSQGDVYELSDTIRRIGTVGAGLQPFAVRLSPTGRLAAVIAEGGTAFVDTATGRTRTTVRAQGDSFVSDVAFIDSEETRALVVTSQGAVRSIGIRTECDRPLCIVPAPREATAVERADYGLRTGTED
ncbi:hypothetical protein MHN80_11155 [Gordonia McavH-238-E]|uniref:hypothetical protein n=1 Tax=Gordonia sp. McavH-238-E TaxID=2917736 RepID=UPI001EF61700|nr:hypothetical protein [Gordonia sp. McavH-238-E]MCG7632871.1 hypothetical protein [Gordonia sp. McavH-238-E]